MKIDQDEWYISGLRAKIVELEVELKEEKMKSEELVQWKEEMLALEAQWDEQAVASELGLTLGTNIRPKILPAIKALKSHVAALKNHSNNLIKVHCDDFTLIDLQRERISRLEERSVNQDSLADNLRDDIDALKGALLSTQHALAWMHKEFCPYSSEALGEHAAATAAAFIAVEESKTRST